MLLGSATEFHASIWASHGNELRALAGAHWDMPPAWCAVPGACWLGDWNLARRAGKAYRNTGLFMTWGLKWVSSQAGPFREALAAL